MQKNLFRYLTSCLIWGATVAWGVVFIWSDLCLLPQSPPYFRDTSGLSESQLCHPILNFSPPDGHRGRAAVGTFVLYGLSCLIYAIINPAWAQQREDALLIGSWTLPIVAAMFPWQIACIVFLTLFPITCFTLRFCILGLIHHSSDSLKTSFHGEAAEHEKRLKLIRQAKVPPEVIQELNEAEESRYLTKLIDLAHGDDSNQ